MRKTMQKKSGISEELLKPPGLTEEERRAWAIARLQRKARELGFPPRKADFEDIEKMRIKAALGPWPRALEAAGLKEPGRKKSRSGHK